MKTGIFLLIMLIVALFFHCFALRQRIEYLEQQRESDYARGMVEAVTAMQTGTLKVLTNTVNHAQTAFEKEVAP